MPATKSESFRERSSAGRSLCRAVGRTRVCSWAGARAAAGDALGCPAADSSDRAASAERMRADSREVTAYSSHARRTLAGVAAEARPAAPVPGVVLEGSCRQRIGGRQCRFNQTFKQPWPARSSQAALALAGVLATAVFERRRIYEDNQRRDVEWRREKCNGAYSQAICYLFKLQVSSRSAGTGDKDVRQHLSESQRFLSLLQAIIRGNLSVRS